MSDNFYARQDVTSHGFATLCRICELPVTRRGPSARRSPTGWTHWGSWQGIRCPGRLTGAQPGRQISEAAYLDRVAVTVAVTEPSPADSEGQH